MLCGCAFLCFSASGSSNWFSGSAFDKNTSKHETGSTYLHKMDVFSFFLVGHGVVLLHPYCLELLLCCFGCVAEAISSFSFNKLFVPVQNLLLVVLDLCICILHGWVLF